MANLRLAVVSDAIYPWHKGGKEVRYHNLLPHLAATGIDITVYTMRWWDTPPPRVSHGGGSVCYKAISPRMDMYTGPRRSIPQAIVFAICCLKLLFANFDILEADHMPYLQLFPLRLITWAKRKPFVVSWHEVWGKSYWIDYLGQPGRIAALIESAAARLPDLLLTLTKDASTALSALTKNKVEILLTPPAVDTELLNSAPINTSAPDLLFIGRLISHKNPALALDTLAVIKNNFPTATLGIIGSGPEEDNLRAQRDALSLADSVTLYGALDTQAELWALLKGTSVLLFPSMREGFGIVVAEALSCGTPVICLDHPSNEARHLIDDQTGTLTSSLDPTIWASIAESYISTTNPAAASPTTRVSRSAAFAASHPELDWATSAARLSRRLKDLAFKDSGGKE